MKVNQEINYKKMLQQPQAIKVIYPPGFSAVALNEIKTILENLWAAKAFKGEILSLKTEIRIQRIYFFAITELLLRSKCLSDIRLIIYSGKAIGKKAFEKACHEVSWSSYINKSMSLKIKVNSVGSQAFHEGALRDKLDAIVKPYVAEMVSGDDSNETTCLYADLYKDKLILSISLAGSLLYKRGYREKLSASAPLREDFAACCIQKALDFAKEINPLFSPDKLIIPFSGTGTFVFEYLLNRFHIPLLCFEREYAIQKMPFFKKEYFNQINQKAREYCILNPLGIECIDNSANANEALANNLKHFNEKLLRHHFPTVNVNLDRADFFEKSMATNVGDIFMMLNPPYGIRLAKNSDTPHLYKKIAKKINEMTDTNVLGFILCPSEEAWSAFCNTIKTSKIETYHFTQGGLDIRVCQFYISVVIPAQAGMTRLSAKKEFYLAHD